MPAPSLVRARGRLTCALVHALLGHVLVLVDPFTVALEEDLHGWHGFTAQDDGVAFDDVGIIWLLHEVRQRSRSRWDGLGKGFAVIIS